MGGVFAKKCFQAFIRSIQDYANVFVARLPRVLQKCWRFGFIHGCQRITKPIERRPQRRAPLLIPLRVSTGIAATILAPALDTVNAAPRSIWKNLDKVVRGIAFEELSVICELSKFIRFYVVQGEC